MNSKNPQPIRRISSKKYKGLGDVVATIAEPIAAAVDKLAGTNLATCAACARRREKLNKLAPFKPKPE